MYNIVTKHGNNLWINIAYLLELILSTDYKQAVSLAMLRLLQGKSLNFKMI